MRKIFALFAVFAAVLFFLPGTAQASQHYTPEKCDNYLQFTFCYQYLWSDQNDGSGVHVDGVYIDINNGCGDLESAHPAYNLRGYAYNQNLNLIDSVYPIDMNDCHAFRTLNLRGPDTGQGTFTFYLRAAWDLAPDFNDGYRCLIKPNNPDQCDAFYAGT